MSIASAIQNAQTKVASAYSAVSNKGGTLPVTQNLSNLPTAIGSIPSGGGGSPVISSLNVTPTTSAQTITAPSGTDGYSPVNVSAVTSSIDNNIVAGNIKKDVTILGVVGNYEGGGGSDSKFGCTIDNFIGDVDADGDLYPPDNIGDITFTGVKDIRLKGLYYAFQYKDGITSVSFPDLTAISGIYGFQYAFSNCTALSSVSFPKLTTISGSYACQYGIAECRNLTSVSFPELTTISGNFACNYMLYYSALSSVSFPKLTTISGQSACARMFGSSNNLTSVSFPALTTLTGAGAFSYMFRSCVYLTSVSFPALTTTSFGSNVDQFGNMMNSTGSTTTHTIHFPSNLESTIQGLSGYPLFGGKNGYVTLVFDLTATS